MPGFRLFIGCVETAGKLPALTFYRRTTTTANVTALKLFPPRAVHWEERRDRQFAGSLAIGSVARGR